MTQSLVYFDTNDYLCGLLEMTAHEVWKAGINLDDWDYGIVLEGNLKSCSSYLSGGYNLCRLLTGVCDNEWYEVKSKSGKCYTVGMAYHS